MTNQSSKEIWAFWKGIEGDSNVYFSTSGGSPPAANISAVAAPLRQWALPGGVLSKISNTRTAAPASARSRAAVAGNLQLGRTIFNFSQEDLGRRCELHRTHISAIERQELNVGLDTVQRIATVFNVPAYVMLMPRAEAQALLYEAFVGAAPEAG